MGRPRKKDEETQEQVEETPATEPEAAAVPNDDEARAEEPAADEEVEVAAEPVAVEEPAPEPEEATAEEPEPAQEPAAEAEEEAAPAEEAPAEEPEPAPAAEAPAAPPAPPPAPKPKRKRVARSERRQRSKPARPKPAARKPIVRLPKPEHVRGPRKERRGVVVSAAMDKTIVVRVDTVKPHPVYKKIVRRSAKLHAHDEGNTAKPGDVVRIVETRPLSKTKNWRLAEILEEAK
jgi:small subunit ribosomal protein S17